MAGLLEGKRGLIMGVANNHSIAWGIAKAAHEQGAELAMTYQGDSFEKRARPLAEQIGADVIVPCDVEDIASVDALFDTLGEKWGSLDFVVHAIAFSDREQLKGRYADTTRDNFVRSMIISCFSFTEICKRASALMTNGGSLLTLTYDGSMRVSPSYNVMGVAKAALESSVRYLATDLGTDGIRVNAISAGPVRTLAGAGISGARYQYHYHRHAAPLNRSITIEDVGGAGVYLLSDLAAAVTGEIHYVDAGYNIVGIPKKAAIDATALGQSSDREAAE